MKETILVVEDDDIIADAIAEVLRDEGYPVILAVNGAEAMEYVSRHAPSLIFLDMKMPVMDGWAFAAAYHSQTGEHVPIIVLTAARDVEERAKEVHAQAFLSKPFDIDSLLALIQRLLP